MKEERTARLSELIFHNDNTFYTVGVFESDSEQFYAVGNMPSPLLGREYRLTGEWKTHPKYGEQFAFLNFEIQEPGTAEGIMALLSSGVIKGVGPATAMLIVKRFGKDSLEIIAKSPERLTEISGIGEKKAAAISEGYNAQKEFADVLVALSAFDITPGTAMKLYRKYGKEAPGTVRDNPYRLIEDVEGIGFRKADMIASKIGYDKDSPYRIKSALTFVLEQYAAEGNTYMERVLLLERTAELIDVSRAAAEDCLEELCFDGRLCADNMDGLKVVMLRRFCRAERSVASGLYLLANASLTAIPGNYDKLISAAEKENGVSLSAQQKEAVKSSLSAGVSIITGGPGTGKTTIINTILRILTSAGVNTALAAPTGRAAKRMEEAAGSAACTIHRLLEYYYSEDAGDMRFGRTRENPLDYGCIIIDEMSMVDILLMEGLVNAVKPGTRLILVGDADQLPPVGAGNVLRDMLSCEHIHSVRLTEIFRQAAESMIVVNAHAINRGEYPSLNDKDRDFFMVQASGERQIAEIITDLCVRRLPEYLTKRYEFKDPLNAIQVLTPVRKGILGSIELNKALQEALNPPSPAKGEKRFAERIYRTGDRVMQNKNNYQLEWKDLTDFQTRTGVFNGDLGVVTSVDNENGTVNVLYDENRLVSYDYSSLEEVETAFAMTVHKSQGSEFPVVVMPMTRFPSMLATRNLLYTAVTRAKMLVVLVGDPRVCNAMVDNSQLRDRNSGLDLRLEALWNFGTN